MLAKWIRLGLGSQRITTTYPDKRDEVYTAHRTWRVLPRLSTRPSLADVEVLVNSCPTGAIQGSADGQEQRIVIDTGACIACGRCIDALPGKVVDWTESLDFASRKRSALRAVSTTVAGGNTDGETAK